MRASALARSCQPSLTPTRGSDSAGSRLSLHPRGRQGAACASSPGPSAVAVAQRQRREQGPPTSVVGQAPASWSSGSPGLVGGRGPPTHTLALPGEGGGGTDAPHAAPAPRGQPGPGSRQSGRGASTCEGAEEARGRQQQVTQARGDHGRPAALALTSPLRRSPRDRPQLGPAPLRARPAPSSAPGAVHVVPLSLNNNFIGSVAPAGRSNGSHGNERGLAPRSLRSAAV